MPTYRHDSSNYLIERAKPQNFDNITAPSTSHVASRVSLPYDPQSYSTPDTASNLLSNFGQSGESYGNSPEISTLEYGYIARNDDSDYADTQGLLRNFIQEQTSFFRGQRVLDIIVDTTVSERDIYVAWSCYDDTTPKYKIMISKFANDGSHVLTVEVADHLTYDWADKSVSGAYSQRPKSTVSIAVEPLAGGAVCLAFIQETGLVHSPTFPSLGSGSGIMILRKKKTDLTDMAADPIVEIMPPSATDLMSEVDISLAVGANVIHCALVRTDASGVDSLWHGEYTVGAAGAPTVATSKLVLGSNADRLGQPVVIEDGAANVFVFYGQYTDATSEFAIKHIDQATFLTIISWTNHALGYTNIVPFAVLHIDSAVGFAVLWGEDDGTSTHIVYKLKTGITDGTTGGTQTVYTRENTTEVGAMYGAYEDAASGNATFCTAKFSTRERPIYVVIRGINVSASPVSSYRWRQPTDVGLPASERFPIVYNDHADASKLFMAGSTYSGVNGDVYLGASCIPAMFFNMKGGSSWLASMNKLLFVAFGSSSQEFGDEPSLDGCDCGVYDVGGGLWGKGISRRSQNLASALASLTGASMQIELPGSILQGGPPESAIFAVYANSRGELYDPIMMRVGYVSLMPDPEEETVIGTEPIILSTSPPNAVFHSTIERYEEASELLEWYNALWSKASARWAIPVSSFDVALLDGSDEVSLLVPLDLHGENIVGISGIASNPQTGAYYVVGETNQTGGNSFIGRIVNVSGKIAKLFTLTDLYNDITFHSDGRCFGVIDSTSVNQGKIFEIDLETGVESLIANGATGSGQSLAFNYDDGLLYHLFSSPPSFESILPDAPYTITPIATSGSPSPAPDISGFLLYNGSNVFVFQTDLGGANNWYTINTSGAIAFVGAKGEGFYGAADEQVSLQPTSIIGTSDSIQVAGCFYSPSQESMRLMRAELHLKRTGTVADLHRISIVRIYYGNDGEERPHEDDIIWEGQVDLSTVSLTGDWFEVTFDDGVIIHPGAAYALVISRGERIASCYGATSGANPKLQRLSRQDANFVELDSLDLTNGFGETFVSIVAFAIDPSSGRRYYIGTTAESAEQFLGYTDSGSSVQFIARLTGFTVDDIAFNGAGQAYVVMAASSSTQANGFAAINKSTGAISASLVSCSAQAKHAIAWEVGSIFYTINTDADVFEFIDTGVPTITPIAQTGAPSSLTPNAMIFDPISGHLFVYGDGVRYRLTVTGTWIELGKFSGIEENVYGVCLDTDDLAGTNDAANYIQWNKADYYKYSEESTHSSYLKKSSGWSHNVNAMAMILYANTNNIVQVELSRDDGATWEDVSYEVFGRRTLDTWNGVNLEEQQIYGSHVFSTAAAGTLMRIRYTIPGIYHNLKSISYFAK